MTENTPIKRLLRGDEAAGYVTERSGGPCSEKTLSKLRVTGGGPAFRKWGRFPLYDPDDLDRWISSRIGPRRRSTSELVADDAGSHAGSNPSNPLSPRPEVKPGAPAANTRRRRVENEHRRK